MGKMRMNGIIIIYLPYILRVCWGPVKHVEAISWREMIIRRLASINKDLSMDFETCPYHQETVDMTLPTSGYYLSSSYCTGHAKKMLSLDA